MFPTILFSNEPKATESYIENLIKKDSFNSSYIYKISPQEKTILIDQIRDLNSLLQIKVNEKRLICIYSFETATQEAQNAMLKVLEEKTANNQFVLVVSDIQKILPTILSRCTVVDLFIENTEVEKELLAIIENGIENPSVEIMGNSYFQPGTREEAISLFKNIISVLQNKIKSGDVRSSRLAKKAFDILHKLESNNLNQQLAVDAFVIELMKQ